MSMDAVVMIPALVVSGKDCGGHVRAHPPMEMVSEEPASIGSTTRW